MIVNIVEQNQLLSLFLESKRTESSFASFQEEESKVCGLLFKNIFESLKLAESRKIKIISSLSTALPPTSVSHMRKADEDSEEFFRKLREKWDTCYVKSLLGPF